jgi:hypothetical protein
MDGPLMFLVAIFGLKVLVPAVDLNLVHKEQD